MLCFQSKNYIKVILVNDSNFGDYHETTKTTKIASPELELSHY